MTTYLVRSIKTVTEDYDTLSEAIERANIIDAEYKPSFGVQVYTGNEEDGSKCVYDTEKVVQIKEGNQLVFRGDVADAPATEFMQLLIAAAIADGESAEREDADGCLVTCVIYN